MRVSITDAKIHSTISMGPLFFQVLFPTILNMDSYAYNRQLAKRKAIARYCAIAICDFATVYSAL